MLARLAALVRGLCDRRRAGRQMVKQEQNLTNMRPRAAVRKPINQATTIIHPILETAHAARFSSALSSRFSFSFTAYKF